MENEVIFYDILFQYVLQCIRDNKPITIDNLKHEVISLKNGNNNINNWDWQSGNAPIERYDYILQCLDK